MRCQIPQQERFRLAVIDGFSGGGRYECRTAGSPLIFVEVLKSALEAVNIQRVDRGLKPLEIECLLILNDEDREVVELLKENIAPLLADVTASAPKLHLKAVFLSESFETAYPMIKNLIGEGRFGNVLFNLDQCGHSLVDRATLVDIMRSYRSVEIFYTFAIKALLAFLRKSDPKRLAMQLSSIKLSENELKTLEGGMNKNRWLGTAELLVFEALKSCAPFVSPFSINNPDGWQYWLIHFANSYRARQVYNNVLHENSSQQAHFGRSGLNMLSYNPAHEEGTLYLFDFTGRETAKDELHNDIPRLISESGDALSVLEFYENIYNATPAHTDDIHEAIIGSPDVEVITQAGGERRKSNTINVADILKIKNQRSFFPMFGGPSKLK